MENEVKKPTALWRILIVAIPFGVLALCWLFYSVHRFVFGWILIACSAALILALIPAVFIRPLSGGSGIKALRVAARVLIFLALTAAVLLQCAAGIGIFWLAG